MRRWILAVLVFGMLGTITELLLLGHYEDWPQFIPLVLIVSALVIVIWRAARPNARDHRALRATMMLFLKRSFSIMKFSSVGHFRLVACGLFIGGPLACQQAKPVPPAAPPAAEAADKEIAALKADVQNLKDRAVSASVAMADVSFHWSNLWFAGQNKNWPLANYYYSEARNHVRWLIRITPMPKGPDGNPVDLKGIFDAVDTSTFAAVKAAIDKKDSAQFPVVYKAALESCYQCHKSVGRPYLRPMIPKSVPQPIINLDPNSTWPQ